jgi:phosphonate transport system substrate-binding protein
MRLVTILFCFLFLFPCLGYTQDKGEEDILKFCVFPSKRPKVIYSMYAPLVKRLSEATGKTIKLVTAPDKKQFQERAMAGEYDLAVACVACYFQLREKGYKAIARGEPSFYGGVIVKKESVFTDPLQLLGKKVAAMRQHSYAGYLFFHAYLTSHKLANDAQPEYLFLDQMESTIYAVLNGKVDACIIRLDALNSSKLARYRKQVRVILQSSPIPHFPFLVAADLDPQVGSKIRETLITMEADDPAVKTLFKTGRITSLQATSDADYKQFEQEYKKAIMKTQREDS